jgi:hypothetical protein
MGREPLDLGRRNPPPVTLVANGAKLSRPVPATQGVDADAQRPGRFAETKVRHLPKHYIGNERRG